MSDTTATMVIEKTLELTASRERVWQAISDQRELERWFPTRAEWELKPGGTGSFFWDGHGAFPVLVVTVDEPRYLAWRWGNQADVGLDATEATTLVEWWLDERPDGGTTLRLRESGFTTQRHHEGNETGWAEELAELEELLS